MKNLKVKSHLLSALVVGFFLFLAFGSDDSKENNDNSVVLKASINFTGTQFEITNLDTFDYVNANLELNDKYELNGYTLKAGVLYKVGIMQFADKEGNRFDMLKKPQNFTIWCDLGNGKKGFYYAKWQ
jgi:hypothetical protein